MISKQLPLKTCTRLTHTFVQHSLAITQQPSSETIPAETSLPKLIPTTTLARVATAIRWRARDKAYIHIKTKTINNIKANRQKE